ncbi:High mobility group [Coemansia biformis]|uniref:High mobility group n=1 Tax=Coemansia biformis TaxID=1286918 RepID=A0A9W7YEQ5_9FUNG|nr:High mobility group [Coemansia biformis]
MDNFSSIDNLAAPFQPIGNYSQQRQNPNQYQNQYQNQHQHQYQHQGQHQDQHYHQRQDSHHDNHQHHYQHQHHYSQARHTSPPAEHQGSGTHIPSLMFDISALNNPPDASTPPHTASVQGAPPRGGMGAGGHSFSLDPASMQNPPSLPGLGCSDDLGQLPSGSGADDGMVAYGQSSRSDTMIHGGQLPLPGIPSTASGSSASFIGNHMSAPLGGQQASGSTQQHHHQQQHSLGLQMSPQPPDNMHQAMSMVPQVRPYNMMFGIPGLSEPQLVYDERAAMAHMHTASGSWLRIRQPIDYVAPLKKPMNSFLLYSAERRVQLRQTHPDLNTTQQSTILAREWANLADEEKEKYRAEAKQLRDDYNARRAELSLKLQQQLSQQHLTLSLGHPPPPPPAPPSHMGPPHSSMHLSSQELLGQTMGHESHPHAPMHPPSPFGLQQHGFAGSSTQLAQSQFMPPPLHLPQHGSAQFHHTPGPSFSQTPHEDMFGHVQTPVGAVAEQLQFESAFYEPGQDAGPAPPHPYGALQPSPWGPQHANPGEAVQRPFDEHDIIGSGLLGAPGSLFDRPLDGVFQAGQMGGGMGGLADQEPMRTSQSVSVLGFDDVQVLSMGRLGAIVNHGGGSSGNGGADGRGATRDGAAEAESRQEAAAVDAVALHTSKPSSKSRGRMSSPAKRVRKKSKKDPDAPKHPMSAFLYYLTSERPRLADQLSDMSIGQQTKVMAKRWKELDEHGRAPWEKLAKHDKDRYARERREYQSESRRPENPN